MTEAISKPRLNKYDNIKGLAIILIVIGHLLVIKDSGEGFNYIAYLKNVLFIIHLPLFFFISGYFSKIRPNDPIKACKRILIPYIIFCILLRIYFTVLSGTIKSDPIIIISEYGLWFLISLFSMKMSLPIVDKLKYPILTSIALGLAIGFLDISPGLLGISRTFTYLPVFLTGFYFNTYKEKYIANNKKLNDIVKSKSMEICYIVLITIAILLMAYVCPIKFIRYTSHYNLTNLHFVKEIVGRLILIVLQIGLVLIANKLMTNKRTILTKIGINSMAIYLLHLFIKKPFLYLIKLFNINDPTIQLICTLALSAVIVLVLSRDFVSKYLNKFTDGIYSIFFKPVDSLFTEK